MKEQKRTRSPDGRPDIPSNDIVLGERSFIDKKKWDLVYRYLGGFTTQSKGLPKQQFLKENSADAVRARKVLARMIRDRDPLDPVVRQFLADGFDPPSPSGRRLVFRKNGRTKEDPRALKIAHELWEKAKKVNPSTDKSPGIAKAAADVASKYQIGERDLYKIWNEVKDQSWAKGELKEQPPVAPQESQPLTLFERLYNRAWSISEIGRRCNLSDAEVVEKIARGVGSGVLVPRDANTGKFP